MSATTTIQEAIERKAYRKLNGDIEALHEEFRMLMRKHTITSDVCVKIVSGEGKFTMPFLIQLFQNEEVLAAIRKENLPVYIEKEINNLLNANIK